VRIIYDHRVMDGATVARALARLEQILNTSILDEIGSLAKNAPSESRLPTLRQMQA
jgi:pyruvate/2-oxoglutarate dehydrogenase complex dihydrolipoamide acyltransferase (E2) component